jgi:hypothetical protein
MENSTSLDDNIAVVGNEPDEVPKGVCRSTTTTHHI